MSCDSSGTNNHKQDLGLNKVTFPKNIMHQAITCPQSAYRFELYVTVTVTSPQLISAATFTEYMLEVDRVRLKWLVCEG